MNAPDSDTTAAIVRDKPNSCGKTVMTPNGASLIAETVAPV
ncbi:hypothetical protein [Bifidobacterium anseris]|nr:hypothetical protein [Bifidobacterium anseris]